jgi:hypothetical protein
MGRVKKQSRIKYKMAGARTAESWNAGTAHTKQSS